MRFSASLAQKSIAYENGFSMCLIVIAKRHVCDAKTVARGTLVLEMGCEAGYRLSVWWILTNERLKLEV